MGFDDVALEPRAYPLLPRALRRVGRRLSVDAFVSGTAYEEAAAAYAVGRCAQRAAVRRFILLRDASWV